MAVKIKLKRMGKIRTPQYRIIVADAKNKRDGQAIEEIGKYQPTEEPSFIQVDSERAQRWLSVGAQPTKPVKAILRRTGDWQKFKGLPAPQTPLQVAEPKDKEAQEAQFQAVLKELVLPDNEDKSSEGKTKKSQKAETSEKSDGQAEEKAEKSEGEG